MSCVLFCSFELEILHVYNKFMGFNYQNMRHFYMIVQHHSRQAQATQYVGSEMDETSAIYVRIFSVEHTHPKLII